MNTDINDKVLKWRLQEKSDTYVDNWVHPNKFNLTCEAKSVIGSIGSVYFAGFAISAGIVPPISDKLGRKWIFITSLTIQTICYWHIIQTKEVKDVIICNFIIGLCSGGFMAMVAYMNEFLPAVM